MKRKLPKGDNSLSGEMNYGSCNNFKSICQHVTFTLLFLLLFISCNKKEGAELPSLSTSEVLSLGDTIVTGGLIISDGGAPITEKGVCWSQQENPTIESSRTHDGSGSENFTSKIGGLQANTTYYFRAYATNVAGTAYGEQISFFIEPVFPSMKITGTSVITSTSAVLTGKISLGNYIILTVSGICYNTKPNPTMQNYINNIIANSDDFTSSLSSLLPATTYYCRPYMIFRVYGTTNFYILYGDEYSFKTRGDVSIPKVSTGNITSVMNTSAEIAGEIAEDGGSPVIRRGVCLSTHEQPAINDIVFSQEGGTGQYTIKVKDLLPTTVYYVRAFATNSEGTAYGLQSEFITCTGFVSDLSGNVYKTIKIGTQTWTQENLRTTRYTDNSEISKAELKNDWANLLTPAYCWYNNQPDTVNGILYNWYTVHSGKLCPQGWHVPSEDEWKVLFTYLEIMSELKIENLFLRKIGFLMKLGGYRTSDGTFQDIDYIGTLWSSSDVSSYYGKGWMIKNNEISASGDHKRYGFSVRCLKD